jgi:very-short-patch-repair endonuclease
MERSARISRARSLRSTSTDAERAVWAALRGRRFEGLKFRRQVPIERYFADFACVAVKLIVELDGGQHAEQVAYDEERTRVLSMCGWRVIRFGNNDALENIDGVARAIFDEIKIIRG